MADETIPATATATTPATATTAATPTASGQPRPGYRGKCLYKTGKCNNERALKTSGQSHNLCDEHRHRQNEHQRKLDAKNRFARKDKRAGSVKGDSPTGSAMAAAAVRAAHGHRYAPYGKVRMSPNAAAAAAGVDDVHAILGRNGIVPQPMMQFHALGVDGANAMAANGGAPLPGGSPEILPSGVVILPNGPQAPQMPYPSAMQDFDGIVVPLPSYLEGHERVEFRSRIYQKVLDFIAEECMRRFGAVGPTGTTAPPQMQPSMVAAMNAAAAAAAAAVAGERRDDASTGAPSVVGAATTSAAPTATNTTEDAKPSPSGEVNSSETQDASGEKKAAETGKDASGDDTQPEDAEEHCGEDEADEAPRSKRATRLRNARKETQAI